MTEAAARRGLTTGCPEGHGGFREVDLRGSLDGQVGSLIKALIFPDYLWTEEEAEVSTRPSGKPRAASPWDVPPRVDCEAVKADVAHVAL